MTSNPFRGSLKIGRNDPCFCGSGRKYKHCHGRAQHTLPALLASDRVEKSIIEQGRRHFEKHKAQELQRQKQQGFPLFPGVPVYVELRHYSVEC